MASDKNYTADFKRKVAQEALDQSKENLHTLAQKYDVPVSAVMTWATQLEKKGPDAFKETSAEEPHGSAQEPIEDHETVDVEITKDEITESISYGVMKDNLDYRRLVFWSVLGTALLVIFVQALMEMFQYNAQVSRSRISESSQYYELTEMRQQTEETLSSFGVVNLEEGVYRIPIDSAINELAGDSE